jgi:putative Ca2+/H+ antiporter (TMEM165/GDT1 family)
VSGASLLATVFAVTLVVELPDKSLIARHRTGSWSLAALRCSSARGDITQITTANFAARYHDPLIVGLAAVAC